MADDVITLGLKINANDADQAAKKLDTLGKSADKASTATEQLEKQFADMQKSVGGIANSITAQNKAWSDYSKAVNESVAALNRIADAAEKAAQNTKNQSKATQEATDSTRGLITALGAVAGAFTGNAIVQKIKEIGMAVLDVQAATDKMNATFTYTSGSLSGAAREMEYVSKFSKEMGLNLQDTAKAYASLQAAAKGTAAEGEVARQLFEGVAKAATVMGLSAEDTTGVLLAFQQIISKGTVQAEELRGQIGERLPGAFNLAADAMGVTTEKLGKMMEAGLPAEQFVIRMAAALNQKFGKEAVESSNNAAQSVNKLETAWFELKKQFAEAGAADFAKEQINVLRDGIDGVTESIKKAKEEGKGFFGQLVGGFEGVMNFLNPRNAYSYKAQSTQGKDQQEINGLLNAYAKTMKEINTLENERASNSHQQKYNEEELARLRAVAPKQLQAIQEWEKKREAATEAATTADERAASAEMSALRNRMISADALNKKRNQLAKEAAELNPNGWLKQQLDDLEDKYGASLKGTDQYKAMEADIYKKYNEKLQAYNAKSYQAQIAAQQAYYTKAQAQYQADTQALENAHKLQQVSDEEYITKKGEEKERLLQIQKQVTEAQLASATKQGDLAAQKRYAAEVEKINTELVANQKQTTADLAILSKQRTEEDSDRQNKYLEGLQKEMDKLDEEAKASGKVVGYLQLEEAARMRLAAAQTQQQIAELGLVDGNEAQIAALQRQLEFLNKAATMNEGIAGKMQANTWARDWRNATNQVVDWLGDAATKGGESFRDSFRKVIGDLKAWFAKLILRPIVQPIMDWAGNMLGMMFGTGQNMAQGMPGQGGGMNMLSAASGANSIFNGVQGIAGMGNMLAMGAGRVMNAFGGTANVTANGWVSAEGGAGYAGGSVGPMAAGAAGAVAGYGIGNLISGQYGSKFVTAAGTAAGMYLGAQIGSIGGPLGAVLGGVVGGLLNRAFGMGDKEYKKQGIQADFNSGTGSFSGNTFATYHQDGGWFRSDKNGMDTGALDSGMGAAVSKDLKALADAALKMGKQIGDAASNVDTFTTHLVVEYERTGDAEKDAAAFQEAYQKQLGVVADQMAHLVLPTIDKYKQGNETASETLVRLGAEVKAADEALAMMGHSGIVGTGDAALTAKDSLVQLAGGIDKLTQLAAYFNQNYLSGNEQVAVAQKNLNDQLGKLGLSADITRQQIKDMVMAQGTATEADRQRLIDLLNVAQTYDQIKKAQDNLTQSARELAAQEQATAIAMSQLKAMLAQLGAGNMTVTPDLLKTSFPSDLAAYFSEFGDEVDNSIAQIKALGQAMQGMGLPLVTTKQQFIDLVDQTTREIAAGVPGAQNFLQVLLQFAPAFGQAANAIESAVKASEDAVKSAQQALESAQKNVVSAQKRVADAQQRIVDLQVQHMQQLEDQARQDMLQGLQEVYSKAQQYQQETEQRVQSARSVLTDAYNRESQALQTTADKFRRFAASLRTFKQGLDVSDLSPDTPEQKYNKLWQQLMELLPKAQAGDEEAQGQVQNIISAWLEASRTLYASSDKYKEDFEKAKKILDDLSSKADDQSDQADEQLKALKEMVENVLPDLADKTVDVKTAIEDFQAAQKANDDAIAAAAAAQAEIDRAQQEQRDIDRARAEEEYNKQIIEAQNGVQEALDALAEAESQVAAAQDTLAAAERRHQELLDKLSELDDKSNANANANALINAWLGFEANMRGSLNQAIQQAALSAQNTMYHGGTPQPSNDAWQAVDAAYKSLLGRTGSATEYGYWISAMANQNMNVTQLVESIKQSPEYKNLHGAATGFGYVPYDNYKIALHKGERVLSSAERAYYELISRVGGSASFARGLDYVPYDGMPATLHQGERVLTNAQARGFDAMKDAALSRISNRGGGYDAACAAELRALRAEVAALRAENHEDANRQIETNAMVTQNAANVVVDGHRQTVEKANWRNKTSPTLA